MKSNQNFKPYKIDTSSKINNKMIEMKDKSKKQLVLQLVQDWYNNSQIEKIEQESCFQIFVQRLSKASGMKIMFDNSISQILAQLSKELQFLQFSKQIINPLKENLELINEVLKENKFISSRQYIKFTNTFLSSTLEDSIYLLQENLRSQGYLKRKFQNVALKKVDRNMSQQDKNALIGLWNISMMVEIGTFWRYILQQKIQHRQLLVLFKIYEVIVEEATSTELKSGVKLHFNAWIQRKRQEKLTMRKLQTSLVEYDHFLDLKAQKISVYLNKERWSLHMKQYEFITEFLTKICTIKDIKFQPYGSFRSKFFVTKYSDIDIGLYYKALETGNRQKVCNALIKLNDAINLDKKLIPYCRYSKVYMQEKIKVPFVKVIYDNCYGANKDVVPTMDIIINNYQGIENSDLLALYSEDLYILKFCNLIKYWAVNRSLINMYRKMEGPSSYGLLLMCLYYLMVTNQIPYLQKFNGKYEVGMEKFNIKNNFLDNFIGFLKFYSYEYTKYETQKVIRGQFHRQKLIVCLLKDHEGKKFYNEDFIINMYDFIDGTNPGRMRTQHYDKFRKIFDQTLQCLEQRSISFLEIVYQEDQNRQKNENKFPRRGNRFL